MKFRLTARPDSGEPFEISAGPRDQLAWERAGANRKYSDLVSGYSMRDLYSLGHIAATRAGLFAGSLTQFEEQVDLEPGHTLTAEDSPEVETDDEVPTRPAP